MRWVKPLLATSRPRFWHYLAGPVVVGAVYGAATVNELGQLKTVLLFGYFLVPANLYLYGLNDIFDAQIDKTNPKKSDQERRYQGELIVPAAVIVCGLAGISLIASVPRLSWLWVGGFLVLGAAYSVPPLRFKIRPGLDSMANGLYVCPGIAAFTAVAGQLPPPMAIAGGWLWTMAMHTYSAIPDIEPDRLAGIETLASLLGKRSALLYCGGCWSGAAIAFGVVDLRLGALLAGYPVMLATIGASKIEIDRAYWWFPLINVTVGGALTVGGLWGLLYG